MMLQKLAFGTSMFLLLVMFFGSIYYVRFSKLENAYGENLITKNAALHSLASGDSDQPNQSEKNKTVRGIKR